jgi:predicted AlkP superfamily phosphohydrolase/phosphomutase
MKQLIIGIDGGTREIFERMPMPFLHERMAAYFGPELEIDLLSRGWAEQISGTYAHTQKGFYVFPQLDGSRDFLFKYSLQDMLSHEDVAPIWDVVLNAGAKVGVMNIPTTFPAPEVDGFFVSGAGGGLNKVDGVPKEMCYPNDVAKSLEDLNYVVDIRLGTSTYDSISSILDDLMKMAEIRTEAFLTLCQQKKPDFGFIAFRHLSVLLYLGMSEISSILGLQTDLPHVAISEVWKRRLKPFFAHFDSLLKRIVEELQPTHLIFSSDHGMGATCEYMNPNAFLREQGFQKVSIRVGPSIRRVGGALRRLQKPSLLTNIDSFNTEAFSDWYSSCIYINDADRFGGPVTNSEIDSVVDRICEAFNQHPEVRQRGMRCEPYRRRFQSSRYYQELADIRIIHKQSVFVSSANGPFFSKNPGYAQVEDFSNVKGGMHSGNKTMYPFFITDPQTANLIKDGDPTDLTLVYKLTERIFDQGSGA